jgi:hypothetical protein
MIIRDFGLIANSDARVIFATVSWEDCDYPEQQLIFETHEDGLDHPADEPCADAFLSACFLWLQCTERRGSESRGNPVRCWSRASVRLTLGGQVGVGHPRCRLSKLPVEWSAEESLGIRGALHFSLAVLTVFTC